MPIGLGFRAASTVPESGSSMAPRLCTCGVECRFDRWRDQIRLPVCLVGQRYQDKSQNVTYRALRHGFPTLWFRERSLVKYPGQVHTHRDLKLRSQLRNACNTYTSGPTCPLRTPRSEPLVVHCSPQNVCANIGYGGSHLSDEVWSGQDASSQ